MNNYTIIYFFRFTTLAFLQVFILNHIDFLGYLNPYPYIIFILLAPITINISFYLVISFLLGLVIDIFCDSGGIHAISCLFIAYIRPILLRSIFGLSYEFQTMKLGDVKFREQLVYVMFMVFIHHLILFLLEYFNFSHISLILKKTFFTSVFTIIVTIILLVLFRKNDS